MLTFLEANGHQINATDPELADWIIQLSGDLTPEQLAERIAQTPDPGHAIPQNVSDRPS